MTVTGVTITGGKATVETDCDNVVDGMTRMVALLTSIARGDSSDGTAWNGDVVRALARECLNKVGITWTRS